MENCIFCKIVKGEIPSYKVFEDENFLGFLDAFPTVVGHTLLIPKKHYNWVWDLEKNEYLALMERAKDIAVALKKAFNPDFVGESIIGIEILHAHVHLMPNGKAAVGPKLSPKPTEEEFKQITEKIKKWTRK